MKRIISVILLLLFCGTAFAEGKWDWEKSGSVREEAVILFKDTISSADVVDYQMYQMYPSIRIAKGDKIIAFRREWTDDLVIKEIYYVKLQKPSGEIIFGYVPLSQKVIVFTWDLSDDIVEQRPKEAK